MWKKQTLLALLIANSSFAMEDQYQEQTNSLSNEIDCHIVSLYMNNYFNTPRQFIESLCDITQWRLAKKNFGGLSKDHIIEHIQRVREIKGIKFIEKAIFKAYFLNHLNITSWLYYALDNELENSMAYILKPLIVNKFDIKSLQTASDKLIGFIYRYISKIKTEEPEDVKTLMIALFFILHYTGFDQNSLKNELIDQLIRTLQDIAYASGVDVAKNNATKSWILIKFLAKICVLEYISLDRIEILWNPFFEEYRKKLANAKNSKTFEKQRLWLSNCIEADRSIKNLLREQYEQFKAREVYKDAQLENSKAKPCILF